MIQQILGAELAVASRFAACVAYFWGTNWLLDRLLASDDRMAPETVTRRDNCAFPDPARGCSSSRRCCS